MANNLPDQLREIEKRLEAATPGPWLWGDWTIFDSDREAQKRREPYWTLIEPGSINLARGPLGRKATGLDNIASGCGHDESDINISKADAEFIAAAPTDISRLLKALRLAIEQRDLCSAAAMFLVNPFYLPHSLDEHNDKRATAFNKALSAILEGK